MVVVSLSRQQVGRQKCVCTRLSSCRQIATANMGGRGNKMQQLG